MTPDYIVEGTSGGDLIDGPYTGDPEGDLIDNNDGNPTNPGAAGGDNDSVIAGAGNDTVLSSVGNDTVDAGSGSMKYMVVRATTASSAEQETIPSLVAIQLRQP